MQNEKEDKALTDIEREYYNMALDDAINKIEPKEHIISTKRAVEIIKSLKI